MNSRQLPKQQKPTAAERNAAASRRASSISRIAHELINQLSALNLVGSNVIAVLTLAAPPGTRAIKRCFNDPCTKPPPSPSSWHITSAPPATTRSQS